MFYVQFKVIKKTANSTVRVKRILAMTRTRPSCCALLAKIRFTRTVEFAVKKIIAAGLLCLSSNVFATCIGLNCTCTISSSTFNFGAYSPLNSSPTAGTSNLSVTCSALLASLNVSYVISLNTGSSGNYTNRTMKFSSSNLNYNIYTTVAHSTVWGDGTSSTGTISDNYTLSVLSMTRMYTMFGLIPALQNLPAGTYTDSITATVTF
ncbi:MAG: spore coat protein U domain-containing protein [Gammaproteobacteria bacterium]|nr:spore coat protein U domain-containing protein [Gammaproteobacteria bacterium]